jgi:hypothetical protein
MVEIFGTAVSMFGEIADIDFYAGVGKQESSWFPNPTAEVKDSDGLMLKILKVLIKEPADSLYRFVPLIDVLHLPSSVL